MKKVLKVGCLSVVGFFVIFFILAVLGVLPEAPVVKEPVPIQVAGIEKESAPPAMGFAPPLNPKMLVWDKTPAEQGLKVGDWISVRGRANGYIGATTVRIGDRNYGRFDQNLLSNIDPQTGNYFIQTKRGGRVLQVFGLDYSKGFFSNPPFSQLESPEKYVKSSDPTQLYSPKIRVGHVWVFNIPDSSKSPVVRQYNLLMFHNKDDVAELIASGRITKISEPSTVEGVTFEYIDIEYSTESLLQLSATDAEISQAMQEAKETAASVMQRFFQ